MIRTSAHEMHIYILRVAQRRRPPNHTISAPLDAAQLQRIGSSVRYVGSVEHKDTPSFAGFAPSPKARRYLV